MKSSVDTNKEFQQKTLSSCIQIFGGGTPKRSVMEYWTNGTIPWLSVKDFNNDRRYVNDAEEKITELGLQNSSTNLLQEGDIIISARGTVGALAMIAKPMAFNQSCFGLRANPRYDSTFLFYLLRNTVAELGALSHGSVFDTITRDTFDQIDVSIPPLDTQRKIAAVLGALDDKIETNDRIIENLQEQARLQYKDAMSRNPQWQIKTISELSEVNKESYSKRDNEWEEAIYLDTGGITESKIDDLKYINLSATQLPSRAKRKVQDGDVIFSTVRPIQKHWGILSNPPKNMLVSTAFTVIRSTNPAVTGEMIYLQLTNNEVVEGLQQIAEQSVSTYPSIRPQDIVECTIRVPEGQAGASLALELREIRLLVANLRRQNHALSSMRDTLLPRLMSGELDVSEVSVDDSALTPISSKGTANA